jgi:uncharacterized protein
MLHLPLLSAIIADDIERCKILSLVRDLRLADCWIGAGFVRNAVWDHLHGYPSSPFSNDVDVIWFDPIKSDAALDGHIENELRAAAPSIKWSVKNQRRMHIRNNDAPYLSATDAMRYWPETATAIAVKMKASSELEFSAPYGLEDIFNLIVRPTPNFVSEKREIFLGRITQKQWLKTWPRLEVIEP